MGYVVFGLYILSCVGCMNLTQLRLLPGDGESSLRNVAFKLKKDDGQCPISQKLYKIRIVYKN
jgi:hypothetical protein